MREEFKVNMSGCESGQSTLDEQDEEKKGG